MRARGRRRVWETEKNKTGSLYLLSQGLGEPVCSGFALSPRAEPRSLLQSSRQCRSSDSIFRRTIGSNASDFSGWVAPGVWYTIRHHKRGHAQEARDSCTRSMRLNRRRNMAPLQELPPINRWCIVGHAARVPHGLADLLPRAGSLTMTESARAGN